MNTKILHEIRSRVDAEFNTLLQNKNISGNNTFQAVLQTKYKVYEILSQFITSTNIKGNNDSVNHPSHYTSHPSGVECIEVTRHYCFSIGNAIKYLWRAGLKKDAALTDKLKEIEDLNKAIWYIKDRIKQLQNELPTA